MILGPGMDPGHPWFAALATRVRGHAGESIGTATSQRVGRGFELHGHDPYRPGDDARAIDWRARIRTGDGVCPKIFLV